MRFVTSPLVVAVALGLVGRIALEEEDESLTDELASGVEQHGCVEADPDDLDEERGSRS